MYGSAASHCRVRASRICPTDDLVAHGSPPDMPLGIARLKPKGRVLINGSQRPECSDSCRGDHAAFRIRELFHACRDDCGRQHFHGCSRRNSSSFRRMLFPRLLVQRPKPAASSGERGPKQPTRNTFRRVTASCLPEPSAAGRTGVFPVGGNAIPGRRQHYTAETDLNSATG